jgi:uncharacterized membrane protein
MNTLHQMGRALLATLYGSLLAGLPLVVLIQSDGSDEARTLSGVYAVSALVIALVAVGSVVLVGFIFTTFFGAARRMTQDIESTTARTEAINRLNKRLVSGEINVYEYRRQVALLGQPGH